MVVFSNISCDHERQDIVPISPIVDGVVAYMLQAVHVLLSFASIQKIRPVRFEQGGSILNYFFFFFLAAPTARIAITATQPPRMIAMRPILLASPVLKLRTIVVMGLDG